MSSPSQLDRLGLQEFADRFQTEMIPLGNRVAYFPAALQLSEEEVREHLEEPIASLPGGVLSVLPPLHVFLVPYLAEAEDKDLPAGERFLIALDKPTEKHMRASATLLAKDRAIMAFSMKDQGVADYHYVFFHSMAELLAPLCPPAFLDDYTQLLREELGKNVYGEVDEKSWQAKESLLHRQKNVQRDSKRLREYSRQSLVDSLTLYLHGVCCDIDVEPGPRQLPSRYLRKRLDLIYSILPPPEGYTVFPEELNT